MDAAAGSVRWRGECGMTNFERHKEQILNLIQRSGRLPSKLDGKLTSCGEVGLCRDCDFNDDNDSCGAMFAKWLYEDDGEASYWFEEVE